MKKTFNLTDLTKKVSGIENVDSEVFISMRKRINRHIQKIEESLGVPHRTFEAPIEQLDAYVHLIKELLNNPENDGPLDLLTKTISKGKRLSDELHSENLKRLINIFAQSEKLTLGEDEKVVYEGWLQDQLSDEYYIQSQKRFTEIMDLIKDDFSFFDNNLKSLQSKLNFLEQYINDIRNISRLYRNQINAQLLFESCCLEVISSHEDLRKKRIYTPADYYELPPYIQDEIQALINKKQVRKNP